jgi:hypothetical protein
MKLSRRQFNQAIGAVAAAAACSRRSFGYTENALKLGLNTWSCELFRKKKQSPSSFRQ